MSDHVPSFTLDSSPEVIGFDDANQEADDMVRVRSMSAGERERYLQDLINSLTGHTSTPSTSSFSYTSTTEASTIIERQDVSVGHDLVYISIIIVGGLIVVWFVVVVINSIHRYSSHRLLTVDGLGILISRFVVAVGALVAIRRAPVNDGHHLSILRDGPDETEEFGESFFDRLEGNGGDDSDDSSDHSSLSSVDLESQVGNQDPGLSSHNPLLSPIFQRRGEKLVRGQEGIKI